MSDEIIVFNGDRIEVVVPTNYDDSDQESDTNDGIESDIHNCSTDIYSDEHRWDTQLPTRYRFRPDIWWCQVERFFSNELEHS